jgi:hypothetical protein
MPIPVRRPGRGYTPNSVTLVRISAENLNAEGIGASRRIGRQVRVSLNDTGLTRSETINGGQSMGA